MESCNIWDLPCWLGWVVEEIKALFSWLWESILMALISLLSYIPVPDWLSSANTTSLPSSVGWMVGLFELQFGLSVIVSAYVARFLIRRLPFVG